MLMQCPSELDLFLLFSLASFCSIEEFLSGLFVAELNVCSRILSVEKDLNKE